MGLPRLLRQACYGVNQIQDNGCWVGSVIERDVAEIDWAIFVIARGLLAESASTHKWLCLWLAYDSTKYLPMSGWGREEGNTDTGTTWVTSSGRTHEHIQSLKQG